MARINIEECWWSDPRRTALLLNIGFEADSAAVNMWRTAQEFWGKSRGLVPREVFFKLKHAQALIDAGLADVQGELVYVRGSSESFEWHVKKREQASEAGKKSAEVRKQKNGTAQPEGGKGHSKSERQPNDNRTDPNASEPSGSGSGSNSKNYIYTQAEDLERAIPLTDQALFQKKYPDPPWLKDQIRDCHAFHLADPDQAPRTKGQWMRKLHTWLSNNWEKRPKLRAVPETGGWD